MCLGLLPLKLHQVYFSVLPQNSHEKLLLFFPFYGGETESQGFMTDKWGAEVDRALHPSPAPERPALDLRQAAARQVTDLVCGHQEQGH